MREILCGRRTVAALGPSGSIRGWRWLPVTSADHWVCVTCAAPVSSELQCRGVRLQDKAVWKLSVAVQRRKSRAVRGADVSYVQMERTTVLWSADPENDD